MRKVGLLIDTASSYGRGLLRGIARYARLSGPWTLRFDARDVDGVIALVRTPAQARRALASRIPFVDLDFTLPRLAPWPVRNDERAVSATAAAHLSTSRPLWTAAAPGMRPRTPARPPAGSSDSGSAPR